MQLLRIHRIYYFSAGFVQKLIMVLLLMRAQEPHLNLNLFHHSFLRWYYHMTNSSSLLSDEENLCALHGTCTCFDLVSITCFQWDDYPSLRKTDKSKNLDTEYCDLVQNMYTMVSVLPHTLAFASDAELSFPRQLLWVVLLFLRLVYY